MAEKMADQSVERRSDAPAHPSVATGTLRRAQIAKPLARSIASAALSVMLATSPLIGALFGESAYAQETRPNANKQLVDLLASGRMALDDNRPNEALIYFSAALGNAPKNRQGVLGRAQALAALSRYDDAIAIYGALLKDDPTDRSALFYRALAYYQSGAFDNAERDLEAALKAGLTLSVVYQRIGDVHYARGKLLTAREWYQRAIAASDPDSSVFRALGNTAYGLGDFETAERAYSTALQSNPKDGYAAYYRAWAREKLGRGFEALKDYNLAFALLGSREPRVAIDRGEFLLRNGAAAPALEDFRVALDLQPENPAALYGAAAAMLELGQSAEAEERLKTLIAIVGADTRLGVAARFQRARAFILSGQYREALADLDFVIQKRPSDVDAYFNRAIARARTDDVSGAFEDLTRAARLRPDDAEIHYALARSAVVAGIRDAALAAIRRAEALEGTSAQSARARAVTLLALDRPQAALRDLDARLRKAPRDANAMRVAGAALIRLGRYDDALALAQRLGVRRPRSPDSALLEARAYIGLFKPRDAQRALKRATALGAPPSLVTRLAGEMWITTARLGGANARNGGPGLMDQGGALENAERAFDHAIEKSTAPVDVLAERARVRIMRGEIPGALQDLNKAIGIRPQDAELRFARASVLKRLKRCEDAIKDYDVGLSLRPDNASARAARASCKVSEGEYFGAAGDIVSSWF